MENNNQIYVSPTPLYDEFAKKNRAELREKNEKGIFDKKFKFTPKEKREFINNWLKYFPDMSLVDSKEIGRLVGPFYIGVVFVTYNHMGAGFLPHLYASSMCEYEVKTGFSISYSTKFRPVTNEWPEEVIEESINYEKNEFFIKTEGPISLDDIFNSYIKFKEWSKGFINVLSIKVPVLIAAWAGEMKKAEEYYEWAESLGTFFSYNKDYQQEISQMRKMMNEPEKLRYNFFESVKALKLEKASYQDIEGVSYKAKDEFERLFR